MRKESQKSKHKGDIVLKGNNLNNIALLGNQNYIHVDKCDCNCQALLDEKDKMIEYLKQQNERLLKLLEVYASRDG